MTTPLNTSTAQKFMGSYPKVFSDPQTRTPKVKPLVPCNIRVEEIKTVGLGHTPQIIYQTAQGRCATLLSQAQFLQCWRCFFGIQQINISKIKAWNVDQSGIKLQTSSGNFTIAAPIAHAFLERYNRVALEPLSVKFSSTGAIVWNPIHQTISQIDYTGCSCPDSIYRKTICKHQIAAQLCQDAIYSNHK